MRTIATQSFKISDLTLPADYERAAASPKVQDLVKSITEHGLIQRVGIEKGTNELVWGRKRVAAHTILNQVFVAAEIVEFDDKWEKQIVVIRENLDREEYTTDQRDEMLVWIVDIQAFRMREEEERSTAAWPDDGPQVCVDPEFTQEDVNSRQSGESSSHTASKPKKTGPKTKRSDAVSAAAKMANVSKRTVERALTNVKKKKEAAAAVAEEEAPVAPGKRKPLIDTRGIDVPPEFLEKASGAFAGIDAIGKVLSKAKGEVTKLINAQILDGSRLQRIKRDLDALATEVKNATPKCICLYCKLRDPKCQSCHGSGLMSEEQMENVPRELMARGEFAGIFRSGGKFVKLSEM